MKVEFSRLSFVRVDGDTIIESLKPQLLQVYRSQSIE